MACVGTPASGGRYSASATNAFIAWAKIKPTVVINAALATRRLNKDVSMESAAILFITGFVHKGVSASQTRIYSHPITR